MTKVTKKISAPHGSVSLNQVVAFNFRRARQLRGWTQEEVAERLEPFLGQRLPQASISAIERSWDTDKRREFDAQELLVYARCFDVALVWFFLPPPEDDRSLEQTGDAVADLIRLTVGRDDQLADLAARLGELPSPEGRAGGAPTGTTAKTRTTEETYRRRRRAMLDALLDQRRDPLDNAIGELGHFFDELRRAGLRGYIAERTNDPSASQARRAR